VAATGDRHAAEDLTGEVFTSAIEALPGFRGPVEALGGWLFRIARHDLYDFRRRQARARLEPLQDVLEEAAPAVQAAPAVLDRGGAVPPAMLLQALLDMGSRAADAPLGPPSP
jgi:DNA-directed RNA polymerase specialized sigma24 family protein